jgi:hypothetical protein
MGAMRALRRWESTLGWDSSMSTLDLVDGDIRERGGRESGCENHEYVGTTLAYAKKTYSELFPVKHLAPSFPLLRPSEVPLLQS